MDAAFADNREFPTLSRAADAQIAGHLYLSVNSMRSHRIRDRPTPAARTDLVRYAIQADIDPVAPPR